MFVPVIVRPVICIVTLPLLVNFRVYGGLVVFTFWLPKTWQGADRKTFGFDDFPRSPKTSSSFCVLT